MHGRKNTSNYAIWFLIIPYTVASRWGRTNASNNVLCPSLLGSPLLPMEVGIRGGGVYRFKLLNQTSSVPIQHFSVFASPSGLLPGTPFKVRTVSFLSYNLQFSKTWRWIPHYNMAWRHRRGRTVMVLPLLNLDNRYNIRSPFCNLHAPTCSFL